jgi:hypothetical protein
VSKFDLKEYARRGASARAAELRAELAAIYKAFPDLRRGVAVTATPPARKTRARKRKPMSAGQKKEVSVRMKKCWAAHRTARG